VTPRCVHEHRRRRQRTDVQTKALDDIFTLARAVSGMDRPISDVNIINHSSSTCADVYSLALDDASSFVYVNEGAAHCVFERRARFPVNALDRALLRVRKYKFSSSARWRFAAIDEAVWGPRASWVDADAAARDAFYAGAPALVRESCDIDRVAVSFDGEFIASLAKTCEKAERRISRRRRDGGGVDARERVGQLSIVAARERVTFAIAREVYVVEIKPKSGARAGGANGANERTYAARQRLKISRGERSVASAYDPNDLFSGDFARISRAVNALFECPQNNLRVCDRDFAALVDEDGTRADAAATISALRAALPSVVAASADIFAHILRAQSRDEIGYERAHALAMSFKNNQESLTRDDLDALRNFMVAQIAKDCSVVFTIALDDDGTEVEHSPGMRSALFTADDRTHRSCVFAPQIIDVSMKSLEKTAEWFARDAEISRLVLANEP